MAAKGPDTTGGSAADDMGDEGGGDSIFAEINITPLTDVFLVMVVIFMVSALAVQAERNQEKKQEQKQKQDKEKSEKSGIKLNLPEGQSAEIDPSKPSLVIEIPLDDKVYVGGKEIKPEDLDKMFRNAFARDKYTQVILKADRGVVTGRLVALMEQAKRTGLTRLAIGTGGK
jgi:biopolymer transport protein ExbD